MIGAIEGWISLIAYLQSVSHRHSNQLRVSGRDVLFVVNHQMIPITDEYIETFFCFSTRSPLLASTTNQTSRTAQTN